MSEAELTCTVPFQYTDKADRTMPAPRRQTSGSSGYDICANFPTELRASGILIGPREYALVPTGLILSIPDGYEAVIRPRSGLALKFGVTVLNSPGTIDADYRGEVGVILINHGTEGFQVSHGTRIAQICFQRTVDATFLISEHLQATERGTGGFGSSETA